MSVTAPPSPTSFGAPLIGQTEKALNAILTRELTGTGLSEHHWVCLTLAIKLVDGGLPSRHEIVARVGEALKLEKPEADALVAELADAGLLKAAGSRAEASDAGRRLHGEVRGAVTQITERLWGDLPAQDLEAAAQVLGTVLVRANAELLRPQ